MIGAIIDIGSGSIGLSTVLFEKDKVPTLKFSARYDLPIDKTPNPKRILHYSAEILRHGISEMQKAGGEAPSRIFCFLSPHLVASQTRVIKVDFKEPTKIVSSAIDDIVEKELERFRNDHMRQPDSNPEALVEKKIMRVKLNGYEVSEPNNKVAKDLEVSVFYTITSIGVLEQIKSIAIDSFHNNQIEFHSFPFAYFSTVRDLFKEEEDFVFLDIGSEITDLCISKAGVFVKSVSFPGGKSGLIRVLLDKEGSNSEATIRSLINGYLENSLDEKSRAAFSRDLDLAGAPWTNSIKSVFNSISLEEKLPEKIFILADKDIAPLFKRFIGYINMSDLAILNRDPDIRILVSADFKKFCDNKSGSQNDLFLIISSIFVNKLLN